jgi:hypothetical protein
MSRVCMTTCSGRQVDLLAPSPDAIVIGDIAHHLALQVRWVGAVRSFYSVAQHSVHVAQIVPGEHRLWALLHDASEAYLGDVSAPLKGWTGMSGYRALEAQLQHVIEHRFGLRGPRPASVDEADHRVRVAEAHDLLVTVPPSMQGLPRAGFVIHPKSPAGAKAWFLNAFAALTELAPKGVG